MRLGLILLIISLYSCQPTPGHRKDFSQAQQLVDEIVAKHPEIVRLTIHAVPLGETKSRIIACNVREKLGKLSDPEDLEAMKTKKAVVLREGNNLDITSPILDKAGNVIAATGITVSFIGNTTEEELIEKAKKIAQELTAAIQAAKQPLW